MNSQQVQDILLMYEAVYNEELRQKAEEYNNSSNLIDEAHAADTQYGVKSLINPYSVRSVVPRFPGLTLPEPDNSIPKVNIPKFPSPKGKTERKEKPRETPRVAPPVAQKPKAPKVTTPPVVSQKPQLPKTPNPLMVDMPKGPGSMASPEKPTAAPSGPRTPISPGYFGGGVGTRPSGMSGGTSTVKGLDRSVTSGLTTKSQDEAQRKAREKSALSQRVAGYRSGGPSVGVREELDLFDYLLEYLVAEGYADTNQDALVLMANMTKEDIDSILLERRREDMGKPRKKPDPVVQFVRSKNKEGMMTRSGETIAQHETKRGVKKDRTSRVEPEPSSNSPAKKLAMKRAQAERQRNQPDPYRPRAGESD